MDCASISDLDSLDREALVALYRVEIEKLDAQIAARDEQLRRQQDELDIQRQALSEQVDELRSRSERIDHLKLMIDKYRHMLFGKKSEKITIQLEQLELSLKSRKQYRLKSKRSPNAFPRASKRTFDLSGRHFPSTCIVRTEHTILRGGSWQACPLN